MELKKRLKSIPVWLGIFATIIAVSGISPSNMTDWGILIGNIIDIFKNPFILFSILLSIYAYLNNPTDKGAF